MDKKEYTRKLEGVIKQMLKPIKDVPFNIVIEATTGFRVVPFDAKDKKDTELLSNLKLVASMVGKEVNKQGILRARANEVGNDIEPYVRDALNKVGYKASIPQTKNGQKKSMGYPDIEFVDIDGRVNYLECKTYNQDNLTTTQRSFYLSPSENPKITKDAHHLVLSFEVCAIGSKRKLNVYNVRAWKIISLENLSVDVKYEFNADNKRLYDKKHVLAEGEV